MTKLTKKVALECALCAVKNWNAKEGYRSAEDGTVFTTDEVVAKLDEMWNALNKKVVAEKKPTEQQKQNESFKVEIEVLLADGKARTATEILNEIPALKDNDISNQRVSALLRQLKLAGKVKSETVKGKSMFSVAEGV
jgi:outer membrane PBP1 activator LpoA protein